MKMSLTIQERIPPRQARLNALKGLRYIKQGSKAGTRVGRIRARQLSKGVPLSENVIKRMKAFGDRHRKNKSYVGDPAKDNGYVAWMLWGGDEGIIWANSRVRLIKQREGIRKA